MLVPENLQFNIVDMAWTRSKRNLITVILFIVFLALSAAGTIIFHSKLVGVILMPILLLISYLISKKAMQLKKLGMVTMTAEEVLLVNEVNNLRRNVPTVEISKIFIRGGARVDIRGSLHKKTLFLDHTLHSGEEIVVHIEVKELDEHTADRVTEYCKALNIVCYRKL